MRTTLIVFSLSLLLASICRWSLVVTSGQWSDCRWSWRKYVDLVDRAYSPTLTVGRWTWRHRWRQRWRRWRLTRCRTRWHLERCGSSHAHPTRYPTSWRTAVYIQQQGAITSKIKHAIKLKTSPARLVQLLQPSLAFCFSLQLMTAYCARMLMRAATVVQILQDLFCFIACFILLVIAPLASVRYQWVLIEAQL